MSSFDSSVLEWLRKSNLPEDKRCQVLEASRVSIEEYQRLKEPIADSRFRSGVRPRVPVNYDLLDEIADQKECIAEGKYPGGEHWDPADAESQQRSSHKRKQEEEKEAGADDSSPFGGFKNFKFGSVTVCEDNEEDDPTSPVGGDDDGFRAQESRETFDEARTRELFDDLEQSNVGRMRYGGRRKTVSAEVINMEDTCGYEPPVYEKSDEDTRWLQSRLCDEFLFEHLEDFELARVVNSIFVRECTCGDTLFNEGNGEEGEHLWIMREGHAQVTQNGAVLEERVSGEEGWMYGEVDLMYGAEADRTVTITSPTARIFGLQRMPYRFIVTLASKKKREMYGEFLSNVSFLRNMTSFERCSVADALKPVQFLEGQRMISFGDPGTYFFIIVEGSVEVIGRTGNKIDDPKRKACDFTVGDCVGELEFVNGHDCVADVIATTPIVRAAKMGKRHFEKVMGPVGEQLRQRAEEDERFAYYRSTQK